MNSRTILHVGHTRTTDDMERICKVFDWLHQKGIDSKDIEPKFIDLNKGQDFLARTDRWTMVVLHFICREEKCHQERRGKQSPTLTISPLANWVNWRKRLVSTNADYIFLFGGRGEVGYSYICSLDGYRPEQVEEEFWVFCKKSLDF